MNLIPILLKSVYILLGIITILLGKFLSPSIIMPSKKKYRLLNERRYIKSCRQLLFGLGMYYIFLGIFLIIIHSDSIYTTLLSSYVPLLVFLPLLRIMFKHIRPMNENEK
jgi:hypothetical protein